MPMESQSGQTDHTMLYKLHLHTRAECPPYSRVECPPMTLYIDSRHDTPPPPRVREIEGRAILLLAIAIVGSMGIVGRETWSQNQNLV